MNLQAGGCLAPTYDEAGEDLADAMARLHLGSSTEDLL